MPLCRCICCSTKGDQADMEPTYDWIHPSCLPRWHRRRELGAPIFGLLADVNAEKAWMWAAGMLVVLALVQAFAGCVRPVEAQLPEPADEIWSEP